MAVVTRKRIEHLSRYFLIGGLLSLFGYWYTGLAYFFLALLGPPFILASWLRLQGGVVSQMIPNNVFFNNLFFVVPITLVYFGFVGFQLKNILNERGKIRYLLLVAFLGFLVYVHVLAFQEIALYWEGSTKL